MNRDLIVDSAKYFKEVHDEVKKTILDAGLDRLEVGDLKWTVVEDSRSGWNAAEIHLQLKLQDTVIENTIYWKKYRDANEFPGELHKALVDMLSQHLTMTTLRQMTATTNNWLKFRN